MNDISVITDNINELSKHVIEYKNTSNISMITVEFDSSGNCVNGGDTGISTLAGSYQIQDGSSYPPIYYKVLLEPTSKLIGLKIMSIFSTYPDLRCSLNIEWKDTFDEDGCITLTFMVMDLASDNTFNLWRHYCKKNFVKFL